jgi:hypothetical protein
VPIRNVRHQGTGDHERRAKETTMAPRTFTHVAAILALLSAGGFLPSGKINAQVIDFSKIDAFESIGTGTLRGATQPKTIIWESDTDTKVYWESLDGKQPQTTIIHGKSVQAFQTAGELKLEALGDEQHNVKYGYVLLRLKKQ